jgi:threonine/homoserine/homoserine lactone efflux protein
MADVPPIAIAALTGFASGFLLSIPVGPINLTIINEGARRGFLFAALIALGSAAMEVVYCAIAFTGFSSYFGNRFIKAAMELFSFAFMLYLGVKFLVVKQIPAHTQMEEKLEKRLHPHSAFMMGFVRTMGNPGILVFWIILAANFISREWVTPDVRGKTACIAGVGVGAAVWLVGLGWAVSLGHKKFGEKTLLRMERFSGLCLLGLAVAHGLHIAWKMAKQKM